MEHTIRCHESVLHYKSEREREKQEDRGTTTTPSAGGQLSLFFEMTNEEAVARPVAFSLGLILFNETILSMPEADLSM